MVGYDDVNRNIYTLDPWDRDGQPKLYIIPESLFHYSLNFGITQSINQASHTGRKALLLE